MRMIGNVLIHSFRRRTWTCLWVQVQVVQVCTSMCIGSSLRKLAPGYVWLCTIYYSPHTVDVQFLLNSLFEVLANNVYWRLFCFVYWRLCQKGYWAFCWRTDRFYSTFLQNSTPMGFGACFPLPTPLLARASHREKETEKRIQQSYHGGQSINISSLAKLSSTDAFSIKISKNVSKIF